MIFVVLALHAFVDNVTYPQWSFASEFYFGLAAILVFSSVYLIALYRAKKNSTIHLIALLFIALALGLLVTQSGAGLSPDSTAYITAGENAYSGEGFLRGHPDNHEVYSHWPSLYPLSIAAFMHLGLDSEQAARIIPILYFALLLKPSVATFRRCVLECH